MSGGPISRGNLFILTLNEGREWARQTAETIDAKLHGGQSGTPRTDIIEAEILQQMDKAAR